MGGMKKNRFRIKCKKKHVKGFKVNAVSENKNRKRWQLRRYS